MTNPRASSPFSISLAISRVVQDAGLRLQRVKLNATVRLPLTLAAIPYVNAAPLETRQVSTETEPQNTATDLRKAMAWFDYYAWIERARIVRDTVDSRQCLGRLSDRLQQENTPLVMALSQGTTGVLSLLPTAGALIGSPAKEIWVVYKLMPLLGVLSMLLSLGGNIVPTQANDYVISSDKFDYGGFISTTRSRQRVYEPEDTEAITGTDLEKFAARVKNRAFKETGTSGTTYIVVGIILQALWITAVVAACWFVGVGTVIPWWCTGTYWMMFWYLTVAVTSIFENIVGVPFSQQWTIRLSRAPACVQISPDAPRVAWTTTLDSQESNNELKISEPRAVSAMSVNEDELDPINLTKPTNHYSRVTTTSQSYSDDQSSIPLRSSRKNISIIGNLKSGYNTTGRIVVNKTQPYASSANAFYVIISLEGMSTMHVISRIVAKGFSVTVFTVGTFMFATTTLITIAVGVTAMSVILGAGIFGRVVGMWMASELMRHEPVLHKTVKREDEAAEYLNEILSIPDLVCEVSGHVLMDGRCVGRYKPWLNPAQYIGVLAKPFDVMKLAMR